MTRCLFDTNIYGKIIEDSEEGIKLAEKILRDNEFILHNFLLIREELRKTPKDKRVETKKLRIGLLSLYDKLVMGQIIKEDKQIKNLAEEYFKIYHSELRGGIGKTKIINDFKIIACASINNMDVIYSDDDNSMKSDKARKSYDIVNLRRKPNLRTPNLISYEVLKKSKI